MYSRYQLLSVVLFLPALLLGDISFLRQRTAEELTLQIEKIPAEVMSRRKAALYSDRADLYYRQGEHAKAVDDYEMALQNPTTKALRRHIYAYMARCNESLGQWDRAISNHELATQYDPKYWRRHRDLAAAYTRVELYQQAVQSYQKAISLTSKKGELSLSLAQVYMKMFFYEKAELSLKSAQQYGIEHLEWGRVLSQSLEKQGRFHEALSIEMRFIGSHAAVEDQTRILYLALMSGETALVERTMAQLRLVSEFQKSRIFYQDVVKSFAEPPAQVLRVPFKDPTLKALVLTE